MPKKRKNHWEAINLAITRSIESGCLLKEDAVGQLYDQISKEFPKYKIGRNTTFLQRIEKLIWNKEVDARLQQAVRMLPDPEDKETFQPLYPYIPPEMVRKRAKWHRGITTKRFPIGKTLPGIGRIDLNQTADELEKYKIPVSTFDEPFKIEVKDPKNWLIVHLNGSNIGTRYGGDIMGNVSRRALSDANKKRADAVILTNLISLDVKKTAGPPKVGRALVFGDNVNPDLIKDPEYRKIVKNIITKNPLDEIIYRTPEELVNDIFNGWIKISLKPNGRPEYKGPVYIVLGHNEKELINAATYWELRWWTVKKQQELRAKLRLTKKSRQEAEKKGNFGEAQHMVSVENSLQSQLHRTNMSSIATQEWQRFYGHVLAVVIKKIEKAIPNAKVIGQDTSYVKIGDMKVEVNIPIHRKVTDRHLANYAAQYGPKNLREKLANVVVVCDPHALQFRMTVREADYDGKRGSSKIFVAPIAVPEDYLRKIIKPGSSKDHPLAHAVFTEGFQSGVLQLRCLNGIVDADVSSTRSLEAFKQYPKDNKDKPKYIWVMCGADPHWGGRAKEFVTSKDTSLRLGMVEAVFEMMRKNGLCEGDSMPVHLFMGPDDQTQGQNFKARTQPHPHQMPYHLIEEIGLELLRKVGEAGDTAEARKEAEKMMRYYNEQLDKRGSDFLLDQMMQMMKRNIERNADAYRAILKRALKAGLIVRGVGEFVNQQSGGFDTRNCGLINFGSGNHFEHTLEGELVEGPFYAEHLKLLLARFPEWHGKEAELEKLVVAPLYGGAGIGWGTIQIPGGHEYGVDFRGTPPRMAGWGDTLLGATRNMPMRGNYTRIFNNRLPVLFVCGDKHFCGAVITDYTFFHMCASGTQTDRYGEYGFPPNNTGVSFIGLPVDGPDKAPMLIRFLPFDAIKDFVEDNPRPFDWKNFLPNPA